MSTTRLLVGPRLGDLHRSLLEPLVEARPAPPSQSVATRSESEEESVGAPPPKKRVLFATEFDLPPPPKKVSRRRKKELPTELGTMKVTSKRLVGRDKVKFTMRDSSALLNDGDFEEIYQRFRNDGFLLFRNYVPKAVVAKARARAANIVERQQQKGDPALKEGYTVMLSDGTVIRGGDEYATGEEEKTWTGLLEDPEFTAATKALDRAVQAVARGRECAAQRLYAPVLLDPLFTWLRVKCPKEQTVEHADVYHFLNHTTLEPSVMAEEPDDAPVYGTCWLPLQDVSMAKEGGLALLAKSHSHIDYTPGQQPKAPLPKAFFYKKRPQLEWHCTDYRAGDLLLFNLRTIHATPRNSTDEPRFSIDTRFLIQPHNIPLHNKDNKGETNHLIRRLP
mmetsp:Transcript_38781/g.124307  ORF Transcript_38781/g.124307 Transcript_38781/m.124307 type:complete len:393 (+) Transcript_38781:30-1208(+)|eukprot:CAMPEP_0118905004 /NCGR_PEP_ID=MMETSP1166-20130328/9231_1 /TAXON_ID=1104430 /ORGANISM="Chrysoreinhardia sp, Strain CCMP3193" /LENGTH=392 /DNA_ID=CAMNT_0006844273 /DNA_START=24 /DNA_END=1205 /DNA_ORIENTATION=+